MHKSFKRRLSRLAIMIHESASNRESPTRFHLPSDPWHQCERLARQLELAREHSFKAAEHKIRALLACCLASLARHIDSERVFVDAVRPMTRFAAPVDIYRDLLALFDEFPYVGFSISDQSLAVRTEPIDLEGVELGSFEIRLNWDQLDRSHAYQTIAIDANPASSDKSITHPHVQDGTLCEGEGRIAIREALASGRLLDFFLIIRSLLTTYNRGGAYVQLHNWNGVYCRDCGDLVSAEDIVTCNCGRHECCGPCTLACANCGDSICSNCSEVCEKCGEPSCSACICECDACGASLCSHCHNSGRCDSCEKQELSIEEQPT